MNGEEIGWNKPQRVTIGLPSKIVPRIMDEWLYRDAPVAMTVRRAKTKGLTLLIMELGKEDYSRAGASSRLAVLPKWT